VEEGEQGSDELNEQVEAKPQWQNVNSPAGKEKKRGCTYEQI